MYFLDKIGTFLTQYGNVFQPEWAVGDWSNCTAVGAESESQEMEDEMEDDSGSAASNGSCPGIMLRNVFCQQMMGLDLLTVVDEELCEGDKPTAQKLCSDDEDDEQHDSEPRVRLRLRNERRRFWESAPCFHNFMLLAQKKYFLIYKFIQFTQ